jgi:hypothetical protein
MNSATQHCRLMGLSSGWQMFVGSTSWLASLVVCAYGIGAILDPLAMFVQDMLYRKWDTESGETLGDFIKLYWHLKNSGAWSSLSSPPPFSLFP